VKTLGPEMDRRGAVFVGEPALGPALRSYCGKKYHRRVPTEECAWYTDKEGWRRVSQPLFDYEARVNSRRLHPRPGFTDREVELAAQAESEQTLPAHAYWRTPLHGLGLQEASLVRAFGSAELEGQVYEMALAMLSELSARVDYTDQTLFPRWEDIPIPIGRAGGWPTCHPGAAGDEAFRSFRPSLGGRLPLQEVIPWLQRDAAGVIQGPLGPEPFMLKVFRLQEAKPARFGASRHLTLRPQAGRLGDWLDGERVLRTSELEGGLIPIGRQDTLPTRSAFPSGFIAHLVLGIDGRAQWPSSAESASPIWSPVGMTEEVVPEAPRTRSAYIIPKGINGCMMGIGRFCVGLLKSHRRRRRLLAEHDGDPRGWASSGTPYFGGRDRGSDFAITPSNLDDASATFLSLHGQPPLTPTGAVDEGGPLEWKGEDTPKWDLSVPLELSRGVLRALRDWTLANGRPSWLIPDHEAASWDALIEAITTMPLVTPAIDLAGAVIVAHQGTIPSGAMVTTGLGSLCNLVKLGLKYQAIRLRMRRGWDPTPTNIAKVLLKMRGRGVVLATDDAAMALTPEEWGWWNTLRLMGFGTSTDPMLMFLRQAFHLRTEAEVPNGRAPDGDPASARVIRHPMLGRLVMSTIDYEPGRKAERPSAYRAGIATKVELLADHPWPDEFVRTIAAMSPGPGDFLADALERGLTQCLLEEAEAATRLGTFDESISRWLDPDIDTQIAYRFPSEWRDYLTGLYLTRQRMRLHLVAAHSLGENRSLTALASARLAEEARAR